MKTLRSFLSVALVVGVAGDASANAFNINEHDARVTGRGGASAASNDGPSSIVFNPGGIAISEGTSIAIGGSLIVAQGSYETDSGRTQTDSQPAVVPSFYATSRVSKRLAVGVGFHLPFGLAVSWPEGHAQSDVIQDQKLRTYFISPSVGLNLRDKIPGLSIGAGVDIVPATIELENRITFGDTTGSAHLGGNALGIGGRAGLMWHPTSRVKLGAMYRSPIKLDFKGNGDFDVPEPFTDQVPKDGPISAPVTLPQSVSGGIAVSPIANLELELDAVWINWSQTWEGGDLSITLPNGQVTSSPQNYKDTVSYRVGLEASLANHTAIRAGFVYDPTPIPADTVSARLPDVDRRSVTVGASTAFGGLGIHLAALWVTPGEREAAKTAPIQAKYGVEAFVLSLGVSGHFGGTADKPAAKSSVAKR